MEVDHVLSEIGEFGPVQIKLFFLLGLPATWMALHVLAPNFIATDPGWTCSVPDSTGLFDVLLMDIQRFESFPYFTDSLSGQNSTMQAASPDSAVHSDRIAVITDPEAKCSLYEKGECVPEFSKDYTSIVTTVWSESWRNSINESTKSNGLYHVAY